MSLHLPSPGPFRLTLFAAVLVATVLPMPSVPGHWPMPGASAAWAKDGGSDDDRSGSDDGSDHDNSGPGNSDDDPSDDDHSGSDDHDDRSGHGGGEGSGGSADRSGQEPGAAVARIVIRGRDIAIFYADGWRERIEADRYVLTDPQARTVIDRPARSRDRDRLMSYRP